MSDETDLELKFGADTTDVDAGADDVKAQILGIADTMATMTAAITEQTSAIKAGFAEMAEASAETRVEMERDFEEEEAGLLGLFGTVREGVESVKELRESFMGFGELIIAAFAVEEIVEFVEKMGEAGEQVEHTAQFFGLTISQVQQLSAELTEAGAAPGALDTAMRQLERSSSAAVSGTQKAADAYKAIGVNLNEARTPAELFKATVEGIAALPGPDKAAVSIAIFGRSALQLAGILGTTKEGLEEMSAAADNPAVKFAAATQAAAQLGEALNMNKVAMTGVQNILADALAPTFTEIVEDITKFIRACTDSYMSGGLVAQILNTIAVTLQAVSTVFEEFGQIGETALGLVTTGGDTATASLSTLQEIVVNLASALLGVGIAIQETMLFFIQLGNDLDYVNVRAQQAGAALHNLIPGVTKTDMAQFDTALQGINTRLGATSDRMKSVVTDANAMYEKMTMQWPNIGSTEDDPKKTTPTKLGGEKKPTGQEDALAKAREQFEAQENAHSDMITDMTADEVTFWKTYEESSTFATLTDKQQGEVRLTLAKLERTEEIAGINDTIEARKSATAQAIATFNLEADEAKAAIALQVKAIDDGEKQGLVSHQQAAAQRDVLIEQEREAQVQKAADILASELALDAFIESKNATTTQAYIKAVADQAKAWDTFSKSAQASADQANKGIAASDNQALTARVADWRKFYTNIGDFARTTTEGLINGTETWSQAFNKILEGMLDLFLQFIEKQVVAWAVGETTKTGATVTGNASRILADTAGAAQAIAIGATSAIARVAQEAAVAAAGTYAALAAVPIIGPILAPAAAATALAAVIALGSTIFSSAGGMESVPYDGAMFQLHKDETVLPADIAVPMRAAVKSWGASGSPTASSLVDSATQNGGSGVGGGGRGGRGDTINMAISALDSRSIRRTMDNPGNVRQAASSFRKHG
jgi:hypothetical protein